MGGTGWQPLSQPQEPAGTWSSPGGRCGTAGAGWGEELAAPAVRSGARSQSTTIGLQVRPLFSWWVLVPGLPRPRSPSPGPGPARPAPARPPLLTWPPPRHPLSLCSRGHCSQTCGRRRLRGQPWAGTPICLHFTGGCNGGPGRGGDLPRVTQHVQLRSWEPAGGHGCSACPLRPRPSRRGLPGCPPTETEQGGTKRGSAESLSQEAQSECVRGSHTCFPTCWLWGPGKPRPLCDPQCLCPMSQEEH